MKFKTAILFALLLNSLNVFADKPSKLITTDLDASGVTVLDLEVHVGEARITASTDGKVHVVVKVSRRNDWFHWHKTPPDAAHLEVERNNERLSLAMDKDKYVEEWTLSIPPQVALKADMGVGDIRVTGLEGDIDLDLGVGDATIEGAARHYAKASGDVGVGDMTIRAPAGEAKNERALVSDSASWTGQGARTINADVGVGDATIRFD